MSMVAFTNLVVVADNVDLVNDVFQSVLNVMVRARNGLWNLPKNQLSKRALRANDASSRHQDCLHVGDHDNTVNCCQLLQQIWGLALSIGQY